MGRNITALPGVNIGSENVGLCSDPQDNSMVV